MRSTEFSKLELEPTIRRFITLATKELQLDELPKIHIVKEVPGASGTTFGRYDPETQIIYLVAHGRHPRDVVRTLGHELVHYKQDIEDRLNPNSGETGSDEENEANALAGVLMRKYNGYDPMNENFADGKNPGRKGLAKRSGVNCKQSVTKLRSVAANSSGEKQRMAHWCANMKSGKKK